MAKKLKCAVCGKIIPGDYHQLWDDKNRKKVIVCRDSYQCQKPYRKERIG